MCETDESHRHAAFPHALAAAMLACASIGTAPVQAAADTDADAAADLALEGAKVISVDDDTGNVVMDPREGYAVEVKQQLSIPGHSNVSATLNDASGRLEAVEAKTDGIATVRPAVRMPPCPSWQHVGVIMRLPHGVGSLCDSLSPPRTHTTHLCRLTATFCARARVCVCVCVCATQPAT